MESVLSTPSRPLVRFRLHRSDDLNRYDKVYLYCDTQEVLGLDIREDMSKGDAVDWRWSDVLAFRPGPWMRDLIEIAAYIEVNFWKEVNERHDADVMARASKIRLPK